MIEDLQRHLDKIMDEQNNRGISKFEGYSPFEMHQILHFTFGTYCPVQLLRLSDSDYNRIPIFNQIRYLTDILVKSGEIKLTTKGFLPTKIVSDLYAQGFIKERHIELHLPKLFKETDSMSINLSRILLEMSSLTKKRNGKLSLTKAADKILADNFELLKLIFEVFTSRFNWAYYDGFGENQIGQLGYGFSLILLSRFGNEKRHDSFYAKKYFKAFPQLLDSIEPTFGTLDSYSAKCYSVRTFERFLNYFGLISIEKVIKDWDEDEYIMKTDLYDKLIKCTPHKI